MQCPGKFLTFLALRLTANFLCLKLFRLRYASNLFRNLY